MDLSSGLTIALNLLCVALWVVLLAYYGLGGKVWILVLDRIFPPDGTYEKIPVPETDTPVHLAARAEVEALGFAPVAAFVNAWDGEMTTSLFFKHADQPIYALLTYYADGVTGYPTAFFSFDAAGTVYMTGNRMAGRLAWPDMQAEDAAASSLAAQLAHHEQRMLSFTPVALANEDALAQILTRIKKLIAAAVARGELKPLGEGFVFPAARAWRTARAVWTMTRASYKAPFQSAVLRQPLLADYLAEAQAYALRFGRRLTSRGDKIIARFYWGVMTAVGIGFTALAVISGKWESAATYGVLIAAILFFPLLLRRAVGFKKNTVHLADNLRGIIAWQEHKVPFWGRVAATVGGAVFLFLTGAILSWQPIYCSLPHTLRTVSVALFYGGGVALLPILGMPGAALFDWGFSAKNPVWKVWFYGLAAAVAIVAGLFVDGVLVGLGVICLGALFIYEPVVRLMVKCPGQGLEEARLRELNRAATALFPRLPPQKTSVVALRVAVATALPPPTRQQQRVVALLLVVLWGIGGLSLYDTFRTRPELEFDKLFRAYENDRLDDAMQAKMTKFAGELNKDDPRLLDWTIRKAMEYDGNQEEFKQAVVAALKKGGGKFYDMATLAGMYLTPIRYEDRQPDEAAWRKRAAEAIAFVVGLSPQTYGSAVPLRLDIAELDERRGDAGAADAAFADIASHEADLSSYEKPLVLAAKAWRLIDRGEAAAAVTLLEAAPDAQDMAKPYSFLGADHAWALWFAGRREDALRQMEVATILLENPTSSGFKSSVHYYSLYVPDLIYMYETLGHGDKARVVADENSDVLPCNDKGETLVDSHLHAPWQAKRVRILQDAMKPYCEQAKVHYDAGKD